MQTGDHNTQDNTFISQYVETQVVPTPPTTVTWPVRAGDIPQMPPAFQSRMSLLAALGSRRPGGPVVRAVTGMRGVGKTQVAAAYARARMADGWRMVAWVGAADMAAVLNGLGKVAARLGISDPGGDLESIAAAVRHWLEAHGEQCLLVFDNAVDLDELRPFLPAAGDAEVLVTSSLQGASDLGEAVPVDVFSQDEALSFLAERTRNADTTAARELAAELGYLPLALAQAAAVIARQRLGYAEYLDRLRRLPLGTYLARVQADPYPRGLTASVLLSMDSGGATVSSGPRGAVLDLVAVLSAAGVSRALLYAAGDSGALGRVMAAGEAPVLIDAALAQLADASLLTFSVDGSSVNAHRLIRRVVRELRAQEGSLTAAGIAAASVLRAASDSLGPAWRNPGAARDMIQQVMALHEHITPFLTSADTGLLTDLMSLRGWALACLNELGDNPAQAIEYGRPLVADLVRILGTAHPDTLGSRNNLANAYRAAGRIGEAIPLFERTLADRERVLGDDHVDTLTSRNNLARAYRTAGRFREAIPLFERTLANRERVLGQDHIDTLTSRGDLAYAYRSAGRLSEAIQLYEATLAGFERLLGSGHPGTLGSRNNLAHAYLSAGQLGEAISLYEATLADREQILGQDHVDTLLSRNNLAYAYGSAGRLREAVPLHQRAVADFERVLGSDHPFTLMSRNALAGAYQAAGRLAEAVLLFEDTLADRERVLGAENRDILTSQNDLAGAYTAAGRLDKAIPLFQRTLADRERLLGHDHPDTLTSQNDLAGAYTAAGRLDKAIPLFERTQADCERVLATNHPLTAAVRRNFAAAQRP